MTCEAIFLIFRHVRRSNAPLPVNSVVCINFIGTMSCQLTSIPSLFIAEQSCNLQCRSFIDAKCNDSVIWEKICA